MKGNKKICLIYNFAQHYRLGIFKLMDKKMNVDFYFGDKFGDVAKLDYGQLKSPVKEVKNRIIISPIYWQDGVISLGLKEYSTYVVLGEYFCLSTWMLLVFCKFSSKKIYLWTHGLYGNEAFLRKYVKKIFYKLADGVILYGNHAKELMMNEGFDKNRLHVIYNSLDYETQIKVRKKLKPSPIFSDYFKNNYPVLIFVGRLTTSKNLNLLLEAQFFLIGSNFQVNVVFVGVGEEMKNLEILVEQLGLQNNVWFFGATYNEEQLGKLIFNADLCVSPGNVGLTAIHSMVYGTPVVTHSDICNQKPEVESIIENVTGMFFRNSDMENLSLVIREWLMNNHDRDKIRSNCYDVIDKLYNPSVQFDVIQGVVK